MVGRLNDKKDGAPGPLHDAIAEADALQTALSRLVDDDIAAFQALAATWKLPAADPVSAQKRLSATIRATETPLAIMQRALDVMRLAVKGLESSKKNCLSDAAASGILAHAALDAARLNVLINLPGLNHDPRRAALSEQAASLHAEAAALRERLDHLIRAEYSGT